MALFRFQVSILLLPLLITVKYKNDSVITRNFHSRRLLLGCHENLIGVLKHGPRCLFLFRSALQFSYRTVFLCSVYIYYWTSRILWNPKKLHEIFGFLTRRLTLVGCVGEYELWHELWHELWQSQRKMFALFRFSPSTKELVERIKFQTVWRNFSIPKN